MLDDRKPNKELLHTFADHDSCVSSIQFSPTELELFSAGTDAQLRGWNLKDGSPSAVCYLNDCFNESAAASEGGELEPNANILTPPMAHSIAINSTGTTLACGLENSGLLLFDIMNEIASNGASKLRTSNLLSGHTGAVSQTVFANLWKDAVSCNEDLLISGGCDKRIISWKAIERLVVP